MGAHHAMTYQIQIVEDELICTKQCSKFLQAENNSLQGGVLHISWNNHEVTLPFSFPALRKVFLD